MQNFMLHYLETIKELSAIFSTNQSLEDVDFLSYSRKFLKKIIFLTFYHSILEKLSSKSSDIFRDNHSLFFRLFPSFSIFQINFKEIIDFLFPMKKDLIKSLDDHRTQQITRTLENFIQRFKWEISCIPSMRKENIVTPEIFEELYEVENPNVEGLVHTPLKIANFMANNALKRYLGKKVGSTPHKLNNLKNLTSQQIEGVQHLLPEIKILDIAVGCGSFYLAILTNLIDLYKKLKIKNIGKNSILEHIICNMIYGIDIDAEAVKVCKIRLTLQILIEEPNFGAKKLLRILSKSNLKTGNSIIGLIQPSKNRKTLDHFINKTKPNIENIEEVRENYTKAMLGLKPAPFIEQYKIFHWFLEFPEIFSDVKETGFDIILGNPPYIGYRTISKEEKRIFKQLYPEIYTGLNDYYYYFIWRALQLLKTQGISSLIVSRYFLEARYAQKLREKITTKNHIETLIDLREYKVFSGVGINATIIFMSREYVPSKEETYILVLKRFDLHIDSLITKIQRILDEPQTINNDLFHGFSSPSHIYVDGNLFLMSKEVKGLLDKLGSQNTPLGHLYHVGTGYHTGRDSVFSQNIIENEGQFFGLVKNQISSEKFPLESELVQEIIKTTDILPFVINWQKKYVILTKHGVDIDKYPLTRKYLAEYRGILENRYEAKRKSAKWYEVAQIRNQHIFNAELKIVAPYKARVPRFAIDKNQRFSSIDVTILSPQESTDLNLYYILGILNSEIVEFFLYATTKKLDARKIELYPKQVSRIPIKIPNSEAERILARKIAEISQDICNQTEHFSFTSSQKKVLINNGKNGFFELSIGLLEVQQQLELLDKLVYKLYDLEGQKDEIRQEIQSLRT